MIRVFAPVLLLAGVLGAQVVARPPSAVVVGVLDHPHVVDDGPTMRASAHLRILRVLAGSLRPNDRIAMTWEYRAAPQEPSDPSKRLPAGPGLWMLHFDGERWHPEVFVLDRRAELAGGTMLPLPAADLPSHYQLPPGTPWERAVAHEVLWVMDELAQRHGAELNPKHQVLSTGAVATRRTPQQQLFSLAAHMLWQLPETETREVYQRQSESPYPNVRMSGLAGLLRAGVPGIAQEVERDWVLLADTLEAERLGRGALRSFQTLPEEDRHALARLALSEQAPPSLDQAIAIQLRHSGDSGLPYLAVFLEHPHSAVRSNAIGSICQILGRREDGSDRYCPSRLPITDAAVERDISSYWRGRLHELGAATLRRPARYGELPSQDPPELAPMDERFGGLASILGHPQSKHPLPDKLDATDRGILLTVAAALRESLIQHQQEYARQNHAVRRAGGQFEPARFPGYMQERTDLQRAALERLRKEISPQGWRVVEDYLNEMHMVRVPLQTQPR